MLDAKFFDSLLRLRLSTTQKSTQTMSGNRKSSQKGISAEFSDFRAYMPGDDLRRLDWNVYARLDKLYIREYMEEKESMVTVFIDTSASMDYGNEKKAELAVDLAKVVSFLALNNMDRLQLFDLKHMEKRFVVGGGKQAFPKVIHWLEQLEFEGEVDLFESARKMQSHASGVVVVISDFMQEAMLEEGQTSFKKLLQYLRFCKKKPIILHTLAKEELSVDLSGAYNLIDMETEGTMKLTVDAKAISLYEAQLNKLIEGMKKLCKMNNSLYVLCDASKKREDLVFQDLRVIYDI